MRLAFGYQNRVGKDTACDYLLSQHGGIKLSFASAVYQEAVEVQRLLGLPIEKDRGLLIWIAERRKRDDPEHWVKILEEQLKAFLQAHPDGNVFVSDLRFLVEERMLRRYGFTTVQLRRRVVVENCYDGERMVWDHLVKNQESPRAFEERLDFLVEWVKMSPSVSSDAQLLLETRE